MFEVVKERTDGTKKFFSLVQVQDGKSDGTVFGRVIVNYNQRQSFWTYWTKEGANIKDKLVRRQMSDAVHRYLDDTRR